jgi:hypothetical protein
MGESLITSFYSVLSNRGFITREEIEADSSSMLPVWSLLRPYLEEWIAGHPNLQDWQRELAHAAMAYEEQRLRFVDSDGPTQDGMAARGDNWGAFVSNVDIASIFEAMHAGQPLTSELLLECAVVLTRQGANSYRAYTTDVSRLADLSLSPSLLETPAGQ